MFANIHYSLKTHFLFYFNDVTDGCPQVVGSVIVTSVVVGPAVAVVSRKRTNKENRIT